MGEVVIREHRDIARGRSGEPTTLLKGEVLAIQAVTTTPGSSVEAAALGHKTHFVAIEPDVNVRYAVRPKAARYTALAATARHTPIPAGAVAIEAVYPGAVLSFYESAMPSGSSGAFLPSYVPTLAL